jgi:hypothetical protein
MRQQVLQTTTRFLTASSAALGGTVPLLQRHLLALASRVPLARTFKTLLTVYTTTRQSTVRLVPLESILSRQGRRLVLFVLLVQSCWTNRQTLQSTILWPTVLLAQLEKQVTHKERPVLVRAPPGLRTRTIDALYAPPAASALTVFDATLVQPGLTFLIRMSPNYLTMK